MATVTGFNMYLVCIKDRGLRELDDRILSARVVGYWFGGVYLEDY